MQPQDWKDFLTSQLKNPNIILQRIGDGCAPFGGNQAQWDSLNAEERALVSLAWHLRPDARLPGFANKSILGLLREVQPDAATRWIMAAYSGQNRPI